MQLTRKSEIYNFLCDAFLFTPCSWTNLSRFFLRIFLRTDFLIFICVTPSRYNCWFAHIRIIMFSWCIRNANRLHRIAKWSCLRKFKQSCSIPSFHHEINAKVYERKFLWNYSNGSYRCHFLAAGIDIVDEQQFFSVQFRMAMPWVYCHRHLVWLRCRLLNLVS